MAKYNYSIRLPQGHIYKGVFDAPNENRAEVVAYLKAVHPDSEIMELALEGSTVTNEQKNRGEPFIEPPRKQSPSPLEREHSFYMNTSMLVGLFYSLPWLLFGIWSLLVLNNGTLWQNWPFIWRMSIGICFAWSHVHSANHARGLFYPLRLWEQSIIRRRDDEEAINAYYSGKRIFKGSREAEVFDGRIVLKAGGQTITPVGNGQSLLKSPNRVAGCN